MIRIYTCFILFFLFSSLSLASGNEWFIKNTDSHSFNIKGEKVHPAEFFKKVSFFSGVEIKYEESLHKGLTLDFYHAELDDLFRYIDLEFSTLKSYSKDLSGKEVLTSLSILPKGQFQSSKLVIAYDPLEEAVAHKNKMTSAESSSTYVTRMESLEIKIREQLEYLAEKKIEEEKSDKIRRKERENSQKEKRKKLIAELRTMKSTDPEMYQRKLDVMSWRYPNLEKSINNQEEID